MKRILISLAILLSASMAAFADTPAEFPGGEDAMKEFIAKNLTYPEVAKENSIEGIITLEVTILPDGSTGPIKIARMIDPDLESEAIRIVKMMPKWTPARDDSGNATTSHVVIPVSFVLE